MHIGEKFVIPNTFEKFIFKIYVCFHLWLNFLLFWCKSHKKSCYFVHVEQRKLSFSLENNSITKNGNAVSHPTLKGFFMIPRYNEGGCIPRHFTTLRN